MAAEPETSQVGVSGLGLEETVSSIGCTRMAVKVQNFSLWCSSTSPEPGACVCDGQTLFADLVHELLLLGAAREKELMGRRAEEGDSWSCAGAAGWYFCKGLLLPSVRPWGLAGQTLRLLPC